MNSNNANTQVHSVAAPKPLKQKVQSTPIVRKGRVLHASKRESNGLEEGPPQLREEFTLEGEDVYKVGVRSVCYGTYCKEAEHLYMEPPKHVKEWALPSHAAQRASIRKAKDIITFCDAGLIL